MLLEYFSISNLFAELILHFHYFLPPYSLSILLFVLPQSHHPHLKKQKSDYAINFYGDRYTPNQPFHPNELIQRRNLQHYRSAPSLRPMQRNDLHEPQYWQRHPSRLPPINNPHSVRQSMDYPAREHPSQRRLYSGRGIPPPEQY